MNRVKNAFEPIRAEPSLKRDTLKLLYVKRKKPMAYKAVACIILIIIFSSSAYLHFLPVSYISIDVNPSVELSINTFGNVVRAKAYNDEGEQILQNIKLTNKNYVSAINILMENESFMKYLNYSDLVFTVVSEDKESIEENIKSCKGYSQYGGMCHNTGSGNIAKAHENGMSFGKYHAYLESPPRPRQNHATSNFLKIKGSMRNSRKNSSKRDRSLFARFMHKRAMPITQKEVSGRCAIMRPRPYARFPVPNSPSTMFLSQIS